MRMPSTSAGVGGLMLPHLPLFDGPSPVAPTREERSATLAKFPPASTKPREREIVAVHIDPIAHLEECPGCPQCEQVRPDFGACSTCGGLSHLRTQYPNVDGPRCHGCHVRARGVLDPEIEAFECPRPTWRPPPGTFKAVFAGQVLPWERQRGCP
jgi:Pyruvate/2-oxoacid:ferredoxin oxidoreductase delta subunit